MFIFIWVYVLESAIHLHCSYNIVWYHCMLPGVSTVGSGVVRGRFSCVCYTALSRCFEIYVWVMRSCYGRMVCRSFGCQWFPLTPDPSDGGHPIQNSSRAAVSTNNRSVASVRLLETAMTMSRPLIQLPHYSAMIGMWIYASVALSLSLSICRFIQHSFIEQDASSGNASAMYSGGDRFKSRPGHRLS
jgi:hypothetical protein